jgi:hypothetical protein
MDHANELYERDMVAIMVERQECIAYPRRRDRVLVCLTGVVNRSIRYTWTSIEDNIVKPLRSKYAVDLAIFNNNIEDSRIDGEILNNADMAIVPHDYLFEYKQSDLDKEIERLLDSKRDYPPHFSGRSRQNGLRLMCLERKVAEFLDKNRDTYRYIVITNADYFYMNKLSLDSFYSIGNNKILSCHQKDCRGYTDGFYVGNCTSMCQILNRINHYAELTSAHKDRINYEIILKLSFLMNNIERIKANILFVKVRSNLTLRCDPPNLRQKLRKFLEEHKNEKPAYKLLFDRIG